MAIQFTYPRKNNPDSSDLLLIADSQNYWRTRQITIEDIAAAVIPGGYTLPTASTTVLGGVRIDGDTINIDGNGAISVSSSFGQQNLQQTLDIGNSAVSLDGNSSILMDLSNGAGGYFSVVYDTKTTLDIYSGGGRFITKQSASIDVKEPETGFQTINVPVPGGNIFKASLFYNSDSTVPGNAIGGVSSVTPGSSKIDFISNNSYYIPSSGIVPTNNGRGYFFRGDYSAQDSLWSPGQGELDFSNVLGIRNGGNNPLTKTFTFQNKSGTLAHLDDIASLQQVTDVGATTNNDISLDDASLKISDDLGSALIISGIGSSMSFGDANTIANSLNSQGGNLLISGNTADGYSGNSMPNSGYSNFIMGEVNIFSSNSDVFSNYNSIHGYGNDVNNLSHSLVVGNYNTTDSIVSTGRGYLGCTMLGDYNNLTGTEAAPGAHLIGYSLTANQPFVTVVGSFNTERTPEYSGTYNAAANFNNGLFARFVVGIGDIGGGAGGQVGAVRRDGFVVLKNGTVTADSLTTTIIDAESTGRVLVTREWIEDNISRESPFLMTATAGGSQTYTGSENIIYLNWSGVSGIYSITLPSAADIPYREIKIVSDGSLNASDKAHVLAPVGESIDGQLNPLFYTLNKAYNGVTVWSDGSNWIVTQAKAT